MSQLRKFGNWLWDNLCLDYQVLSLHQSLCLCLQLLIQKAAIRWELFLVEVYQPIGQPIHQCLLSQVHFRIGDIFHSCTQQLLKQELQECMVHSL